MPVFHDALHEWRGELYYPPGHSGCEPPEGGLVLKDITHQNYHFARDVRTIGCWITYERIEQSGRTLENRFYVLNRAHFDFQCIEQLGEADLNSSRVLSSYPLPMARFLVSITSYGWYRYIFGIRAFYRSKTGFFPPNCDMSELTIDQSYLFTRYSSLPAHEPTGALQAARFYPLIHTHFTANTAFNRGTFPQYKVQAIRFDHRIHLSLDSFTNTPAPPAGGSGTAANFAAVFKDREAVATVPGRAAQSIFAAAEKPLLFELVAKGYENSSITLPRQLTAWDNVHWWGARWRTETSYHPTMPFIPPTTRTVIDHISAPGAFFAVHFHWRWGGVTQDTHPLLPNTPHRLAPQFQSGVPGSINAPLIDVHLSRRQHLSFAVVKYNAAQDPATGVALNSLSQDDFFSLFRPPGKPRPDDISAGDNLVLWMSAKAEKVQDGQLLNGTQLIHGFFFAHNPEPSFFSLAGSRGAEHFPNDATAIRARPGPYWERY